MIGFLPIYSSGGGGGSTPGLSEVLAVSNRELKYIEDNNYFFAIGDETKELVLNGNVETPINLSLVTETLPLESELILNAFKTSGFLDYGDDELRYSYNGVITQLGDAPIEIPLGAKCVIRNVVDEDYFLVNIISEQTPKIKRYIALISQGTAVPGGYSDTPVANELVNQIGEVTYSYLGVGMYQLNCVGAFPLEKWITNVPGSAYDPTSNQGGANSPANIIMNIVRISDDEVNIFTQEYAGLDGSGYPVWNLINNQLANSLLKLEILS